MISRSYEARVLGTCIAYETLRMSERRNWTPLQHLHSSHSLKKKLLLQNLQPTYWFCGEGSTESLLWNCIVSQRNSVKTSITQKVKNTTRLKTESPPCFEYFILNWVVCFFFLHNVIYYLEKIIFSIRKYVSFFLFLFEQQIHQQPSSCLRLRFFDFLQCYALYLSDTLP